jgi:hypothetical protein
MSASASDSQLYPVEEAISQFQAETDDIQCHHEFILDGQPCRTMFPGGTG